MTDIDKINSVKENKPVRLLDLIVMVAVLLVAIAFAIIPLFTKEKGKAVLITADGKESEYSLDEDKTLTVRGLTVVVKDGKVSVTESDCPDGICVSTGEIDGVGQTIVCLPEGVVIKITGESKFQADTGESV